MSDKTPKKCWDTLPQKEEEQERLDMSMLMVSRGAAGNTCPFPRGHKSIGGEVQGWGIPVE